MKLAIITPQQNNVISRIANQRSDNQNNREKSTGLEFLIISCWKVAQLILSQSNCFVCQQTQNSRKIIYDSS